MIAFARLTAFSLACALATPAMAAELVETGGGFDIDDNQSASSDIVVAANETIESLTVSLDIQHTFLGDLIATLSNGTTTVTLFDRPGVPPLTFGNGDDLDGVYTFDDLASDPFSETGGLGTIPEGSFQSQDPLSAFAGASTAGTWTLTISDNAGGDQGALAGWSLNFITGAGAVPEPGTWLLMILGFGAIGASMRQGKVRKASVSYA